MIGGLRCGNCRYQDVCPREFKKKNGEHCEKYIENECTITPNDADCGYCGVMKNCERIL